MRIIVFVMASVLPAPLAQDLRLTTDDSTDALLLAGTFVYVVACQALSTLGETAVESGASGFIGYSGDFQLVPSAQEWFGLGANAAIRYLLFEPSMPSAPDDGAFLAREDAVMWAKEEYERAA
jgi:hypothetical protein